MAREKRYGWRSWVSILSGVVSLLAIIIIVTHIGEVGEILSVFKKTNPYWLFTAILLQSGTYIAIAWIWKIFLRERGISLPNRDLIKLSVLKLFADQAFPSLGVSGTLISSKILRDKGLDRGTVAALFFIQIFSYYCAYVAAFTIALFLILTIGSFSKIIIYISIISWLLLLCVLGSLIYVWWAIMKKNIPKILFRIKRIAPFLETITESQGHLTGSSGVITAAIALQILVFVLDVATLSAVFRMLGGVISLSAAFVSFMFAAVIGTFSFTPGGLGFFEGSSILVMHSFGVSVEFALTATLLFRGLTYWLPFIPGFLISHEENTRISETS